MAMKPYISRLMHGLHEDDPDRRVEFTDRFLEMADADETLLRESCGLMRAALS